MAHLVWLVVVLSTVGFLTAAKTHGRQLRLERERRGYLEVTFGSGTNPEWVEALWRRDRTRFWTWTPTLMAAFGATWWWMNGWVRFGIGLVAVLLWAPTITFWTLALLSLARTHHGVDVRPASERRAAIRGSAAWFALCLATAAAVGASLAV